MTNRKIKRRVGDILLVPLGGGNYSVCQLLGDPLIAFFDIKSDKEQLSKDILGMSPLFCVWVENSVITEGQWKIIGHSPVDPRIDQHPAFFKKDALTGKLSITHDGGDEIRVNLEQVASLERAAVWAGTHIIERLNDHFAGRPNRTFQSMLP